MLIIFILLYLIIRDIFNSCLKVIKGITIKQVIIKVFWIFKRISTTIFCIVSFIFVVETLLYFIHWGIDLKSPSLLGFSLLLTFTISILLLGLFSV